MVQLLDTYHYQNKRNLSYHEEILKKGKYLLRLVTYTKQGSKLIHLQQYGTDIITYKLIIIVLNMFYINKRNDGQKLTKPTTSTPYD